MTPDNDHTDPGRIDPKRLFAAGHSPPHHHNGHPHEYIVEEGDTLFSIAKALLDDGSKWPVIFHANQPMIHDPARIKPGMHLVIP